MLGCREALQQDDRKSGRMPKMKHSDEKIEQIHHVTTKTCGKIATVDFEFPPKPTTDLTARGNRR
jgi:hypothetical protein